MKILVICQYYYPEPFRITDICEELVKCGNEVTVITGIPNYPEGIIYDGYRNGEKRDETLNGVRVHRCFTIGRRSGAIWRFLNYYSYSIFSSIYALKLKSDYDIVFINQLSPVMMANAGVKYKKKHKKPLVLYCLDLWPESLAAGGIARGSILYRCYHRVSEKIYKQADQILITSEMFRDYFKTEFTITDNVQYLPQFAESMFTPEQCKKEPDSMIDLMFAGNVGSMQSVDTIIRAAALTKNIENLRWHIVGDGSELENCRKLAAELDVNSIFFYGRKPVEEMPSYYAKADAMLVTLKHDPVLSMTLPGKVQSYMAAGKPILGAIDGEAQIVIRNSRCGLCGEAENAEMLAQNVGRFIKSADKKNMADNAEKYYSSHFSKASFMDHFGKTMLG